MSDKNTTESTESVNFADEIATTSFRISLSESDAQRILEDLSVPIPNELPNEIHLIISPEK